MNNEWYTFVNVHFTDVWSLNNERWQASLIWLFLKIFEDAVLHDKMLNVYFLSCLGNFFPSSSFFFDRNKNRCHLSVLLEKKRIFVRLLYSVVSFFLFFLGKGKKKELDQLSWLNGEDFLFITLKTMLDVQWVSTVCEKNILMGILDDIFSLF